MGQPSTRMIAIWRRRCSIEFHKARRIPMPEESRITTPIATKSRSTLPTIEKSRSTWLLGEATVIEVSRRS